MLNTPFVFKPSSFYAVTVECRAITEVTCQQSGQNHKLLKYFGNIYMPASFGLAP
jgi:hypothetical protein